MTNLEGLKETLNSEGNIIVAFPKDFDAEKVEELVSSSSTRERLENSVLPIIAYGFICADREKFTDAYVESFFDKCWTLGRNISIISLI